MALAEALAFGLGMAWLVLAYPFVSGYFNERWRRIVVHIGIAWQLLNWYPHDALHMNAGIDLDYMLALELGFHVTMIIATVAMALSIVLPRRV